MVLIFLASFIGNFFILRLIIKMQLSDVTSDIMMFAELKFTQSKWNESELLAKYSMTGLLNLHQCEYQDIHGYFRMDIYIYICVCVPACLWEYTYIYIYIYI